MAISKDIISPPLEVRSSSVDVLGLPLSIREALDYVSCKLAQKRLHLTFVVVSDAHLLPPASQSSSSPTPPLSMFSKRYLPTLSGALKLRAYHSPPCPTSPSSPPLTLRVACSEPPYSHSISLLHAQTLTRKASRIVDQVFTKASKKYSGGDEALSSPLSPQLPSPPTSPAIAPMTPLTPISPSSPSSPTMSPMTPTSSTVDLTSDLVRRSLLQNDILSISEGLTLLSLDHIYTLKVALSLYAKACSQTPLLNPPPTTQHDEEGTALARAVESLRHLILFQNGKCVTKSHLLRAHGHISVNDVILKTVNQSYRERFRVDGIYDLGPDAPTHLVSRKARQSKPGRPKLATARHWGKSEAGAEKQPAQMEPNVVLKLDTNLTAPTPKAREPGATCSDSIQRLDLSTQRDLPTSPEACAWYRSALGDDGIQRLDPRSYLGAPKTPKHSGDVTPITRGEWHSLMGDWRRMAAVETC